MRATKAPSKMEIGRRPDRHTEVSKLAPIDIVNNLATGEKAPERHFSVLFLGISPNIYTRGGRRRRSAVAAEARHLGRSVW